MLSNATAEAPIALEKKPTDLSQPAILDLIEDSKRTWNRLVELDLVEEISHLTVLGYCVIPPHKVGPLADIVEARDALIALAEEERADANDFRSFESGLAYSLYHLVSRGRIFEKWAVNPTVLAIARYLCGEQAILNNNIGWVKSKTEENLDLHIDSLMYPNPLPNYQVKVNITVVLSDYTLEGGCLGVVPGSHRENRHPTTWEEKLHSILQPVECPAGSLVIIPGNMWHGAFPKQTPGLRTSMSYGYSRIFSVPQISHDIDPEILARNGDDFRMLMGEHLWTGFGKDGPTLGKHFETYRTHRSHYA